MADAAVRVEEIVLEGKDVLFIDFSDLKTCDGFNEVISVIELIIEKYRGRPLYTISNVENIRFDSNVKSVIAEYLKRSHPYITYGAIYGVDGVKKLMISTMIRAAGCENIHFAFTKEQAIAWLMKQS